MEKLSIIIEPDRKEWKSLTVRAKSEMSPAVHESVQEILNRVKDEGDRALYDLAEKFDGVRPTNLKVNEEEIEEAKRLVQDDVKAAIEVAVENISAFHRAQLPSEITVETTAGVICHQLPVAIRNVGLYIPGGTAPLFSTVLMLAVPAKIAGCRRLVMYTPANRQGQVAPAVLYAANRVGVSEIYKIGGAQAIGAMAYGTETIGPVDKIFGPGNRYVTMAKQIVSTQNVAIDMPAGPSEVMVIADSTSDPAFVAADILSQCEHGRDSQAIVLTDTDGRAEAIVEETMKQAARLPRRELVADSLANSRVIVLPDRKDMIDFANLYAPEHLILSIENPEQAVSEIYAAGSVFLGNYAPESVGDYASGTNHTLPTSGWATSMSGVNIESFIRRMTIQELSPEGLSNLASTVISMARAEGLDAHAEAVVLRLKNIQK